MLLCAAAVAASLAPGSPRWSFATDDGVWSSPAVAHGRVFFGSKDGGIYAVNASTGGLLWRVNTGGQVPRSCAVQ